jgi:hypothetical protein
MAIATDMPLLMGCNPAQGPIHLLVYLCQELTEELVLEQITQIDEQLRGAASFTQTID